MPFRLKHTPIQTRLLVVYAGIVLIGFSILTLLAGGQINVAVRAEYEQRLRDQIRLIAQGVASSMTLANSEQVDFTQINAALKRYEIPVGGKLTVFDLTDRPDDAPDRPPPSQRSGPRSKSFHNMPEMENALRGEIILVERADDTGVDTFYTAAPIGLDNSPRMLIQLSVPTQNLQGIIMQRWVILGLGFVFVTVIALLTALWLSRSIIQPLYKLRESAMRLSQGDLSHRIESIGHDEIGEVAQAFNEMAGQVQNMLEEQRAFASNTSHELRTPLTAIRLRTEVLIDDPTLDADTARRYIQEIADEVTGLGNLVQDLTLLSRFDAGRAEQGRDEIDFARLAANLCQQYADLAKDKGIQLTLRLPDEPVSVQASLSHLMVVFRNLLDNAFKYTPGNGSITWDMQKVSGAVRHTIRDTGQGILPQDLPHIYERFYRANKAHSRTVPGTGLGLSLVKSVVDAYHCQIKIESEGAGKGTTVTVWWATPGIYVANSDADAQVLPGDSAPDPYSITRTASSEHKN